MEQKKIITAGVYGVFTTPFAFYNEETAKKIQVEGTKLLKKINKIIAVYETRMDKKH